MTPFESGIESVGDTRHRFSVRFFLVALLFIIFDIEAVFIFPWAVLFRELGLFGFIEMTIFLGILLLGLFYIWKKGALEWE
jgi:NADH-quinone oxidoreductase subunit A